MYKTGFRDTRAQVRNPDPSTGTVGNHTLRSVIFIHVSIIDDDKRIEDFRLMVSNFKGFPIYVTIFDPQIAHIEL